MKRFGDLVTVPSRAACIRRREAVSLSRMFKSSSLCAVTILVAGLAAPAGAQMAHRLKGSLTTDTGAPVNNGKIRADAIAGFRGEQFVGQKDHTVVSNDRWPLPIYSYPAAGHPMLTVAIDLMNEGKKDEAAQALTVALGPDVPIETRVAAGEMALILQQVSLARTIFALALQANPKHPRAMFGAAEASLMGRDWETAGKQLWDARDLVPRDQRRALAAAIDDLRGIARVQ